MLSIIVVAALAASVALNGVAGDAISLYIPSFDPQPVTVDLLGVGSDGHTTWRVAGGQPSGSITEDNGDIGTITLVEGPSDAELFMSDTLFGYAIASASGVPLSTETFQETASPIPVQGGTSPAPTAGGSPSTPASAPTAPPTSGSAPSGGPSPTAQTPAGSSPTSAHNGAIGVAASSFLSGVVGIAAAAYLL
ncbi:hypothetical protein EUX98_g8079 [Antrodiella citrinella]|uniref:Uncharacterized protein n=1 Tax=Antrodiella citrinella TaxID=2447956 RepID=A0A4S4MCH2_9APHY|nr:hypothetical protein EUX98_g8079 [Antrodiella citrinella]